MTKIQVIHKILASKLEKTIQDMTDANYTLIECIWVIDTFTCVFSKKAY